MLAAVQAARIISLLLSIVAIALAVMLVEQPTRACVPRVRRIAPYVHIDGCSREGHNFPRICIQTYKHQVCGPVMHRVLRQNRSKNPGWTFLYFDDIDAHDFVHSRCSQKVADMYDSLIPAAFKADLFRLAALYEFGGVYMDAFFQLKIGFDAWLPNDADVVVVQDLHSCNSIYNAFIASRPQNPLWLRLLDRLVDRCTALRQVPNAFGLQLNLSDKVYWRRNMFMYTGPLAVGQELNQLLDRSSFTAFARPEMEPCGSYSSSCERPTTEIIKSAFGTVSVALHCKRGKNAGTVRNANGVLAVTKFDGFKAERSMVDDVHYSARVRAAQIFHSVQPRDQPLTQPTACSRLSDCSRRRAAALTTATRARNPLLTNFIHGAA
jgi:hypothetical protein